MSSVTITRELGDGTVIFAAGDDFEDPVEAANAILDAEKALTEPETRLTRGVHVEPAALVILSGQPEDKLTWVDTVLFFSDDKMLRAAAEAARFAGLAVVECPRDEAGVGVDPDVFVQGGVLHVEGTESTSIYPSAQDPQYR